MKKLGGMPVGQERKRISSSWATGRWTYEGCELCRQNIFKPGDGRLRARVQLRVFFCREDQDLRPGRAGVLPAADNPATLIGCAPAIAKAQSQFVEPVEPPQPPLRSPNQVKG